MDHLDLGLGKTVAAEGGSNVGGSHSNMGHNISVQGMDKIGNFVALPQITTLDNNKHTATRIMPQKEPNLSGSIDVDIPKVTDSVLQRSGGVRKTLDTRGTVNLRSRLVLRYKGKMA